ncbi:MAG: OsmC family protein [Cyanobacteria bacterium HKST-UBA04]|nr:OsmC family protein [Cyanobacteria bacterium HKST-UBA04]MCA9840891.1 OsmC family protein [Cyanobacteria bacterium HKST-UBA03]
MKTSTAQAQWQGGLKDGSGTFKGGSGTIEGPYSFPTRFENASGTNPEELVAAAHAACYSMALSATLEKEGYAPKQVHTTAKVLLEFVDGAPEITTVELTTEAQIGGIDDSTFMEYAELAKKNCPISKLYKGATIKLEAKLLQPA